MKRYHYGSRIPYIALAAMTVGCSSDPLENPDHSSVSKISKSSLSLERTKNLLEAVSCPACEILNEVVVQLSTTKRTLTKGKFRSPEGRYFEATIDETGKVVDPRVLIEEENRAVFSRQGRLRDDLYEISLSSSSDIIPIWIWANVQDYFLPKEEVFAMSKNDQARYDEGRLANVRSETSPIVAWLEARGYKILDRGESSPVVTANVPSSALRALGNVEHVGAAGYRHEWKPASTTWFRATHLDAAQAIVPSTGWSYCNSADSLPDWSTTFTVLGSFTTPSPSAFTTAHTRWTTELISNNYMYRAAPGAPTYLATWEDGITTPFAAWEWCFNAIHARAMNFSVRPNEGTPGGLEATDMAFDFYVKNSPYPLIAASSGNYGDWIGHETVQNRSYNGLSVGASDDKSTDDVADDTIAAFSSWRNPLTPNNDYEVPHVVAPGVDVHSWTYADSGTSASSPIVLGSALLAAQQDSSYNGWPEMLRASVLAASTKSVDGPRTVSLGFGVGDLKQGAGLLNAEALVRIAKSTNLRTPSGPAASIGHARKTYSFTTDFNSSNVSYDTFNIQVPSGSYIIPRVRIAVTFDSTTAKCNNTFACATDVLDGDLDLRVEDSSGTVVCYSGTYDSSWELCDFQAIPGMTYKAYLIKFGTTQPSTYVGAAWQLYSALYN